MLRYINEEYNVLCYNPEETNLNEIDFMTMDQFCKEIGYLPEKRARLRKVYSNLYFLVDDRTEAICSFISDGKNMGKDKIVFNPRILYKGSNWEAVEHYVLDYTGKTFVRG